MAILVCVEVLTKRGFAFQQLLGPVVSQLLVDAPPGLAGAEDEQIPTLDEMDDTIVLSVSQMALTSGSDLFWKPLNREVRVVISPLLSPGSHILV